MTESKGALAVREAQALSTEAAGVLTSAQLKFISNTDFVPGGLRGNMPAILACVATGRALGLPDMTALRSIHIIDGKAAFSAELMVMLARQAGHSITGTVTAEKATVTGKRADTGDEMTVEWTLQMAERAGLLSRPGWKKYPESYLWARAASQLGRMLFADCFAGASYTPEELGAGDVTADELMEDESLGAAGSGNPAAPEDPVLDVADEQIEDGIVEVFELEEPTPEVATQEQRDRLVALVKTLSEKRPDVKWSQKATEKLKSLGVESWNDASFSQLREILDYLAGELAEAA